MCVILDFGCVFGSCQQRFTKVYAWFFWGREALRAPCFSPYRGWGRWACGAFILNPASLQWTHMFLLIEDHGAQGYELFFKTRELKKKWMEQFEMAM